MHPPHTTGPKASKNTWNKTKNARMAAVAEVVVLDAVVAEIMATVVVVFVVARVVVAIVEVQDVVVAMGVNDVIGNSTSAQHGQLCADRRGHRDSHRSHSWRRGSPHSPFCTRTHVHTYTHAPSQSTHKRTSTRTRTHARARGQPHINTLTHTHQYAKSLTAPLIHERNARLHASD